MSARPKSPSQGHGRSVPPVVWALLALLACLAALGASLGSVFTVRQVTIVGASVPADEVAAAAGVTGQNIFSVRSDQVIDRLSQVREIVVRRVDTRFPDQVTIYARMRVPFVAWRDGSTLYLLDRDGVIIRAVPNTDLPVIMGSAGSGRLSPGIVVAVRYAVQSLSRVPNGAIAMLRFQAGLGLTIQGRGGWHAVVGTGTTQTLVNRIATLASFLTSIGDRSHQLQLVDLRYRVPYARFSSA